MEKNVSKKGYRISFVAINVFVSFIVSIILTSFTKDLFLLSESHSYVLFIIIFFLWIIFSIILADYIWSDKKIIVEKISREIVSKYRILMYSFLYVLLLPIIFLFLSKYGIIEISFVNIIVPLTFWAGLLGAFGTMFYFSGSKNISINQILIFPLQFIEDQSKKNILIQKKIKWNWINSHIAVFLGIIYYLSFQKGMVTLLIILILLYGGTFYRNFQLKSLI